MTNPERILNLQKLGYTEREAAFLTLAALHSGYCLRRQFAYFAETVIGRAAADFFKKAVTREHAKPVVYRGDRIIYHLASKPLFEALGEIDNRNRRGHEVQAIKNRLMALDYVLQHPEHTFYATEPERVGLFDELGIQRDSMPVKRYRSSESSQETLRYFIEKFPVARDKDGLIHVCYIDEGLHSTSGLERFLQHYAPLLRKIPRSRFVFIAPYSDGFSQAEAVFCSRLQLQTEAISPELMGHFQDRLSFETGALTRFDQAALIRYREDKARFTGPQYDRTFGLWKSSGGTQEKLAVPAQCGFSTYHLQFNYDLFGTALAKKTGLGIGFCSDNDSSPTESPAESASTSPACGSALSVTTC